MGRTFWMLHFRPFQRSARLVGGVFASPVWPTAVQADADAHDTPLSDASSAPTGRWIRCLTHRVPLKPTATGISGWSMAGGAGETPTAMQVVAVVHDTPSKRAWWRPEIGWMVQRTPFQRAARGRPVLSLPTATRVLLDVHDTLVSPADWGPRSFAHLDPFQRWSNVVSSSAVSMLPPTAVQARAEKQDTLLSKGPPLPEPTSNLGASWTDHDRPFQRSTRGDTPAQQPSANQEVVPTATQVVADVHDKPVTAVSVSSPYRNGGSTGIDCTDHAEPFQRSANVRAPMSVR
jgi:hypothetical protein